MHRNKLPRLVVVIPALNEAATIGTVVNGIPDKIDGIGEIAVIVVDDGSTDHTEKIALEAGARVIRHPINRGLGCAFESALDAALRDNADIIVNMDADGQFNPADIAALVRPIIDDGYGFVTCTRFGDVTKIPEMPWIKRWGNWGMCLIVNWIIQGRFTDVSCGFRAYSRDAALRFNLFGRFTYTQESFLDLASKKIVMTEVPLKVRGTREFGKSRIAHSVWRYATRAFPILAKATRDIRPMMFFGSIAAIFLITGVLLFGFVGVWWLTTGRTFPWTGLLTLGTASSVIGFIIGTLALISDQIARLRNTQEQILYYEKLRYYSQPEDNTESQSWNTSNISPRYRDPINSSI